jgi:DNA topoisomerase-1
MIVEREKEIRAFVKEEYWRVARTSSRGGHVRRGAAALGEERIDKNLDEQRAKDVVAADRQGSAAPRRDREQAEDAPADAAVHDEPAAAEGVDDAALLGAKTMIVAQQLYEGVESRRGLVG